MASNYRRSSKHKELDDIKEVIVPESSDTEFDVPHLKKIKLHKKKTSLKAIHSACEKHISPQASSNERSNYDTKRNNKRKYMIVIDKGNTKNNIDNSGYQTQSIYRLNKSDNASAKDSIIKRRKRMAVKKAMKMDLEDKLEDKSQNFKPFIKEIIENLKRTFSKFKFQIYKLQLKYLEPIRITLQDAADIVFIFSSIICKLKEELSQKQQDLTNSYINCIMMHDSNISNLNYKQCNRDVQEQVDTSSESSTISQITSPDICQKHSVKVTESSSRGVGQIDKEELPLQETNNSISNYQTKDNVVIQESGSKVFHLDSLKMSKLIETPLKKFVVQPKKAQDSKQKMSNKNSIYKSKKLAGNVNRHIAKESVIEVESLNDADSDVSTCSTVMISSQINKHNSKCENYVKCSSSRGIMQNYELREKGEASKLNFDLANSNNKTMFGIKDVVSLSSDTFLLPRKRIGVLSNNRVRIPEQETDFIYPDTNKLHRKNDFTTTSRTIGEDPSFKAEAGNGDTRLDMNCEVLVE